MYSPVSPSFAYQEAPSGVANGTNIHFSLVNSPNPPASCIGYKRSGGVGSFVPLMNGIDFDITNNNITYTVAPASSSNLYFYYRYLPVSPWLNFADEEIPTGTINGSNVTFTLLNSPNPVTSCIGYKRSGGTGPFVPLMSGIDFTLVGNVITMTTAPITGSNLYFYYRYLPIALTSGTSILSGNGTGGFSNVTVGAGLTYSGYTLTANVLTVNSISPVSGNITIPSDSTKLNVINGVAQGMYSTFVDNGSISSSTITFNMANANAQAATFDGSGTITWTLAGWPTSGTYGAIQLEIINGGTMTHVFPAAVQWINPNGTTTTSFSTYMTNQRGTTNFQTTGTDFVCMWTRNNGTTIYAKVL